MAEIVNLRRVKRAQARQEAARAADAQRLKHGRTRAQREAEALEASRVARAAEQAKLER